MVRYICQFAPLSPLRDHKKLEGSPCLIHRSVLYLEHHRCSVNISRVRELEDESW